MREIFLIILFPVYFLIQGCKPGTQIKPQKITANIAMLDSIKNNADSIYSKRYPRNDISKADYFINQKDSTLTQVMMDSMGMIRQIVIVKNKIRIYTACFYPNGQLTAKYEFDDFGQFTKGSREFYENGFVKSEGNYKNGFRSGKWKSYDTTGKYSNTIEYDQ